MLLEIFADTVCPWCYIGKRRLMRALSARPQPGLSLRWRAFQLNPGMPMSGIDRQQYMQAKFGSLDRAQRVFDNVARVGQQEGIAFRFDLVKRTPNTLRSHRLVQAAARLGRDGLMLDRLFAAYFTEGVDIGDADALIRLAGDVGLPDDVAHAAVDGLPEIDTALNEDFQSRRLGITGVPYLIFNGRFGLSGAQEPEVLYNMFDLAKEDDRERAAS
ncbi:putative DsbA family dithiol-disulfide isomerase [Dongia mobilis]|uniref:Putative DsbA family dithiol-disulfide isomerase n=1 Tax=Dongia mobilis TaxID=578943 RepID=A0A4R6WLP0_9PROT|nr:DsbA family oxidoreductase [Dongia mobilis]TDQ81486.1 putative DsbA family dithiol-disulfide isomerase [Dongia mobilis]